MDWTREIDAYCERLGPGLWAEPLNAVTNIAFLVAAGVMAARLRGQGVPLGGAMVVLLAAIGLGSGLFHTFAQSWAALADVAPILGFILLYLYAANRHVWGMRRGPALALTAAFLPFAAGLAPVFGALGLGGSAAYAPVPVLILGYAWALRRRAPETARGYALGAAILVASLTFRTIDGAICAALPLGTHFMWHVLNAVMLGWMIEVHRRHHQRQMDRAGAMA